MTRIKSLLFIASTFSLALSCDGPATSLVRLGTSSIRVTATIPKSTAKLTADPADVELVRLQATWSGSETPEVLMARLGPTSFGIVIENLPSDVPITFQSNAYDSGDSRIFAGATANVILTPDSMDEIAIDLLPVVNGQVVGAAPRINVIRKPILPVTIGSIFPIEFDVSDADDSTVAYQLNADSGVFDNPGGDIVLAGGTGTLSTMFTAPSQPGIVTFSIVVEDSVGLVARAETTVTVMALPPPQAGGGSGDITVNFAPVILGIDVGYFANTNSIIIHAFASDDQPVNELQYVWRQGSRTLGYTNPLSYYADIGIILLQLTVSDARGASTSVQFSVDTSSLQVIDLPIGNQPPAIAAALLTERDVNYGDVVIATLYALDPEGENLSAAWTTDWGSILSTEQSAEGIYSVQRARWTGGAETGTTEVRATISDPHGGSVHYAFVVNQVLGRIGLTCDAGTDQSTFLDYVVTLDGSASSSEDGQIQSYSWEQIFGPSSTIHDSASPISTVTTTTAGTYIYRLTVTNLNNQVSDTVSIAVSDPTLFTFVDADLDSNGIISFLDTVSRKVRRYDMNQTRWQPSFVTADAVRCFAVAPEGNQIYTAHDGGRMDVIDTTTGDRTLFANNPASVTRMAVVGNYVYTQDPTGAWATRSLYSRLTGARTYWAEWTYTSNGFAYSAILGRLFHFRDGTSPNDILYQTVNQAAGTLGSQTDSPYHGGYTFTHPLRLFPDHSRISVASGVIFSTNDLTIAGGLGTSYVDMRFNDEQPILIRSASSQTELVFLNPDFSIASTQLLTGTPLRLFVWNSRLFVITQISANQIRMIVQELQPPVVAVDQ